MRGDRGKARRKRTHLSIPFVPPFSFPGREKDCLRLGWIVRSPRREKKNRLFFRSVSRVPFQSYFIVLEDGTKAPCFLPCFSLSFLLSSLLASFRSVSTTQHSHLSIHPYFHSSALLLSSCPLTDPISTFIPSWLHSGLRFLHSGLGLFVLFFVFLPLFIDISIQLLTTANRCHSLRLFAGIIHHHGQKHAAKAPHSTQSSARRAPDL